MRSLRHEVSVEEMRYMEDQEGLTRQEIAKRLDVSPTTVTYYLGLKENDKQSIKARLPEKTVNQIISLRKKNFTYPEIAKELGISIPTARLYCTTYRDKIHDKGQDVMTIEPQKPAECKPTALPVIKDSPKPEAGQTMFLVLDEKRTVRLQGNEFKYEVVKGGDMDGLTVTFGPTDVAIFDRESLNTFIKELTELQKEFFS
jgi:DNA-binding CsgD family transcriptional regulator